MKKVIATINKEIDALKERILEVSKLEDDVKAKIIKNEHDEGAFNEYMNTIKIVGQYTEELQNLVKLKMYIESEFGLSTKPSKRGRKKVK